MSDPYVEFLGEEIALDALTSERARRVAVFMQAHPELGVQLVAVRRNKHGHDTLVLDAAADIPQRPAHPIQDVERLAASFGDDDQLPMLFALRADFPRAPHTNDMPEGTPIALCLYRDGWSEVRLTWTPGTFIQKIRWWLEETAMGGLYGEGNPVEPLFFSPQINIMVARDLFEECFAPAAAPGRLVVRGVGEESAQVWVLQRAGESDPFFKNKPLSVTFLEVATPVIRDGRVRVPPQDLSRLIAFMSEIGLDLASHLCTQLRTMMAKSETHDTQFALLVAAQIASDGPPRNQLMCFISTCSIAEVAVALGEYAIPDGGGAPGFLIQPDHSKLGEGVDLTPANVGLALDPQGAAELSGKSADTRKIALAGGGALGSALFDILMRQGFGVWSIIDKDHLLAHNLARHSLHRGLLGSAKSRGLASASGALLGEKHKATPLDLDVTNPGTRESELRSALDDAALIIDATASAGAARALAADPASARRASMFLLGDAHAGVVLIEDVERKARLDDLEATLVAAAIADPRIAEQFVDLPTQIATPASCRAPTSRAPWSRIVALAAVGAEFIRAAVDRNEAAIRMFRWRGEEGMDAIAIPTSSYVERTLAGWTVRLSGALLADLRLRRIGALPSETGGVLIGATDAWNRVIHVAAHISDFADSAGTPTSFQRGLAGLPHKLEEVARHTHGALSYIGEWHSHPDGATANPSGADMLQLVGLAETLRIDGRPAVSLIISREDEAVLLGRFESTEDLARRAAMQ